MLFLRRFIVLFVSLCSWSLASAKPGHAVVQYVLALPTLLTSPT
jgi:hypothetical protein